MKKARIWLSAMALMVVSGLHAEPEVADTRVATPSEEMKALAGKGLTEAMKLLQKSGGFYPFSIIYRQDRLQVAGYTGDPAKRPPAEEYVGGMYAQLREEAKKSSAVTAVVLVKPHSIQLEDGNWLNGVWVLADHREGTPWIVFQPLVPSAENEGHYSLGEQVIQLSEDRIFE